MGRTKVTYRTVLIGFENKMKSGIWFQGTKSGAECLDSVINDGMTLKSSKYTVKAFIRR